MAKAKKTTRKASAKKAKAKKTAARRKATKRTPAAKKKATRRAKGRVPAGVAEKLEAERDDLLRQIADLDRRRSEEGDPSGYDDDYGDAETETSEREREISLAENLRDLLDQVEHALARIEDGTYGVCESCEKRIEAARLKALPYASLCIECKRRSERHA